MKMNAVLLRNCVGFPGISLCLYLLGSNRDKQELVQAELDEVVGDAQYITNEHLPKLKYLEAAIKVSGCITSSSFCCE